MADEEWESRCELAVLYRLLAHFGMTDVIYTHISAPLPGRQDIFLISRYGVLFQDMRASDLVRLDSMVGSPRTTICPSHHLGRLHHSFRHSHGAAGCKVRHSQHAQAGIAVSA